MKFLILLCSMLSMSALRADDLVKESNEALKCPPVLAKAVGVDAVEIKPDLAVQTELVGEKKQDEKVAEVALEEELLPTKNLTATEKLKVYRTKLEEKNLVLLEKKLEMIRLQQEMALLRNLEKSMDQTIKNIEKL